MITFVSFTSQSLPSCRVVSANEPTTALRELQVWRSRCGSAVSTSGQGVARVARPESDTMANSEDIRYCQKCSYVFLKFTLCFYSVGWWVSSAACLSVYGCRVCLWWDSIRSHRHKYGKPCCRERNRGRVESKRLSDKSALTRFSAGSSLNRRPVQSGPSLLCTPSLCFTCRCWALSHLEQENTV